MKLQSASNKKVAVITLFDNENFGNRLQCFAVHKYMEHLNLEPVAVPYIEKYVTRSKPMRMLFDLAHYILRLTRYEKNRRKLIALCDKRRHYITSFSEQYICTAPMVSYKNLPADFAQQYDYFITGSDQVWHCWRNDPRELEYFLLMFASPSQRLTIAPSFGFDKFPKKYLKTYKKGLEGFEYLSVREKRGAELIKELTGKEATVLLDPTMLIDTSEWLKILKKPSQYVDDKYIFVYALGGFKGEVKEKTCRLADNLGLQVIDIMDIDSDYYIHTRPDEFLYWIHSARLVVTDSFHASVFSILFNKPFIVTDRSDIKGMGSRLDTLFNKFGITGRHFDELKDGFDNAGETREKLFEVDYSGVPAILETERKKAAEFYKKCFHEE